MSPAGIARWLLFPGLRASTPYVKFKCAMNS